MLTTTHTIMNVENNKIVTGYVITVQAPSCNNDYHVSIYSGGSYCYILYLLQYCLSTKNIWQKDGIVVNCKRHDT